MSGTRPLRRAVEAFVLAVAPVLTRLAGDSRIPGSDKLAGDVELEAFNLTAAFVDADGRHTDDELDAFIDVFGPRFDTVARAASPGAMRAAGLLAGARIFLDAPSTLFALLVDADGRDGGHRAWAYYTAALAIGHTVLALDAFPAHAELSAIERFRSTLLRDMDTAGVRRPGGPQPQAARPGRPLEAASGPPAPAPPVEPTGPPRPIEELLAELDGLVGLAPVKAEVKLVSDLLRVEKLREDRGLPVVEHSRHLVFTGNPGTGKTTVARLLAQIYRTLGVVEKGHLVETDRAGLVAGYVGQTALKVKEVFQAALGGVLLIDEAHALARGVGTDFGHEAIDMIVKLMEDHRDDVVVVVAGYPDEMAVFLDANPGLRSRFPKTIFFPDYTDAELALIFDGLCKKSHYVPTEEARAAVTIFLAAQDRDRGFGNARLVRNLFEAVVARQAGRVVSRPEADLTDEALVSIEAVDVTPPPVDPPLVPPPPVIPPAVSRQPSGRRRRPVPRRVSDQHRHLVRRPDRVHQALAGTHPRPVPDHRALHLPLDDRPVADHRRAARAGQVHLEVAGGRAAVGEGGSVDHQVEVGPGVEVAPRRLPQAGRLVGERSHRRPRQEGGPAVGQLAPRGRRSRPGRAAQETGTDAVPPVDEDPQVGHPPRVGVEDQGRAAVDPRPQPAEGAGRAQDLAVLHRAPDAEGLEVGREQGLGAVAVHRHRGCEGARPAHREVDQSDAAHRAEGLGPDEGERTQPGPGAGGQDDPGQVVGSCQNVGMQQRRWTNPSQPQTLQIAVFLLYINSALLLLYVFLGYALTLLTMGIILGQITAGYGIANERKWGYGLGIAMALVPFVVPLLFGRNPFTGVDIIGLMFDIALVALLLHPQSRDYQRIWFK